MLIAEQNIVNMINSPVRRIGARVELYSGSDLVEMYKYTDALKSFTIQRVGDSAKFFGFGVCQKLNVKLLDPERKISITTDNRLEVAFGAGSDYFYACPSFKVTEVHRDENTNELSVTAYDALYGASAHTVAELNLSAPYTIRDFIAACASLLGLPFDLRGIDENVLSTVYESGANFEGTETIREALTAVAEATQSIYYICCQWNLTFKRLDASGDAALTIDREKYFTLESNTNRRLSGITHATELGDSVGASLDMSGTTQYVRNNPFWDLREDVADLVNSALAALGGLTINQFSCSWRGNPLLEIGDKIALVTKDNQTVISYLLDDTITYDGSLGQETQWSYEDDEGEDADNPTSLGDVLKQTYARVDKANKQIDIVASDVSENKEVIAALKINTESIDAAITEMKEVTTSALDGVNEEIANLTNKVEATMTAEDVTIAIQSELSNGVSKVETETGFTFNEDGLTVSKSDSEMTTTITEDGMTVYKNEEAVLVADNEGVKAEDLHATTYLIIGNNSRFEDFGDRTACFWIGG